MDTAETYWLYRCAEVALEAGYDGFLIVKKSQKPDERYKPVIEGTIELLRRPVSTKAGLRFDARHVVANLRPFVDGPKCRFGNVCLGGWTESVAYGVFMRLTIYNITRSSVVVRVGDETENLHGRERKPHQSGFTTVQYPREAEGWRLSIAMGNCTYTYDMPRNLTDAPWRPYFPGHAEVPVQLDEDMSLHVVAPHPGPWDQEFVRLIGSNYRPAIIPKKACH